MYRIPAPLPVPWQSELKLVFALTVKEQGVFSVEDTDISTSFDSGVGSLDPPESMPTGVPKPTSD